MKTILYHNQSCSKSCAVLAEMSKLTADFEIINYLENTPSKAELKEILALLSIPAFELIRKNEPAFKKFENKHHSEDEWIDIMVSHPILIERPIVIHGNQAAIGRPIERVIDLFQ
ncbi:MAG: arsenate reductase (glutaredoxin) [Crocinitomicaceae bacterium]|nr:arsenate reductase (glutaredoxin) [Crocinitomicaceae bacterium]